VTHDYRFHPGIDLEAAPGTTIAAAAAGKVAGVRSTGSDWGREPAGWEVSLTHPGGWTTRYRFAGAVLIQAGEEVRRGQPLGRLAVPGRVHFALYRSERAQEPPPAPVVQG
jgi:murein DD-endopeptidase MepM/ murein hydrolase activator NlpD